MGGAGTYASVTLPDGSIVVMGGSGVSYVERNDVCRLETAGSYDQHPAHVYT